MNNSSAHQHRRYIDNKRYTSLTIHIGPLGHIVCIYERPSATSLAVQCTILYLYGTSQATRHDLEPLIEVFIDDNSAKLVLSCCYIFHVLIHFAPLPAKLENASIIREHCIEVNLSLLFRITLTLWHTQQLISMDVF
jgi:hypothetical protein